MKRCLSLLVGFVLIFFSCRKDPEIITPDYISEGQTNWTKIPFFPWDTAHMQYQDKNNFTFTDIFIFDEVSYIYGTVAFHEGRAQLFRSTDNGASWSMVPNPIWPCGAGASSEGGFFITPDHGFLGRICMGTSAICQTWDGGDTWNIGQEYGDSFDYEPNENICCMIDQTHLIMEDLRSSDGGLTWQTINSYSNVSCYNFMDTSLGVCATTAGLIAVTYDFGMSWDTLYHDGETVFTCINLLNDQTIFVGGDKIVKSEDGGLTWTVVSDPSTHIYDIQFVDSQIGFAATSSAFNNDLSYHGSILKTTDGGDTWSENYHSDFMGFRALHIYDNQTIYGVGSQTDEDPNVVQSYYIKTSTQGN